MYFSYVTVHPLLGWMMFSEAYRWWGEFSYIHRIYICVQGERVLGPYASGMDTVPLALLLLLVWTLDSVMSSVWSSLFFSFRLLMNLRVISSHSSGSSMSRKPMQMMMVAPSRTTLKIILCFNRSTAGREETAKESNQQHGRGHQEQPGTALWPLCALWVWHWMCGSQISRDSSSLSSGNSSELTMQHRRGHISSVPHCLVQHLRKPWGVD